MAKVAANQPVLVKRYSRSRLYDTRNQCYVLIDQVRGWAAKGVVFSIVDAKTGSDVTRVLLA